MPDRKGEQALLRQYPRDERRCNLGDCPVFTLTDDQFKAVSEAYVVTEDLNLMITEEDRKKLRGTCKAIPKKVSIGAFCSISDEEFLDYYRKPRLESGE